MGLADLEGQCAGRHPGGRAERRQQWALQSWTRTQNVPFINYDFGGAGAHFYTGAAAPYAVADRDIPGAGDWTFVVNSDDGFGLTITGFGQLFQSQFTAGRGVADTLSTFVFPKPGDYNLQLDYWQGNGGFAEEFFAAKGTYADWGAGGTNWALVGDTAHGGLKTIAARSGASWVSTQEMFSYLLPRVASLYDETPTFPATSPRQTPQLYDPTGQAINFFRAPVADPPTLGGWTLTNYKMGMIPFTVTTIKAGDGVSGSGVGQGAGWNVTTYKAGATGFSVTTYKATVAFGVIDTLARAQSVIGTTANQLWTGTMVKPYINFLNTPSTGSTPNGEFTSGAAAPGNVADIAYPGQGSVDMPYTEVDDFAVQATGMIHFATAGAWTFAVNSDEGFNLVLTGVGFGTAWTSPAFQVTTTRTAADSFITYTIPQIGDYNVTFQTWNRTLGAEAELYAAPGTFTTWAGGGTNWALVGDTAHGGLVAFRETITNTGGMAGAEAVLATPSSRVYSATEVAPYINYFGTGTDGGFGNNLDVPGQANRPSTEDINYYVTLATTTIHIPTTGSYTFGYIGDDGFKLTIFGATFNNVYNCTLVGGNTITNDGSTSGTGAPRLGIINNIAAGDYNVRFVWGEGSGGSTAEVFAAPGRWTAWSANAFTLLGAPAVVPTAPGGWNVTAYKANITTINTINLGEGVMSTPSQQSWTASENAPYINYNNDSTAGGNNGYAQRFYANAAPTPAGNNNPASPVTPNLLPADQVADRQIPEQGGATAALDYYVLMATTQIVVPTTGPYTFGVTSDDQYRLTIDSVSAPAQFRSTA